MNTAVAPSALNGRLDQYIETAPIPALALQASMCSSALGCLRAVADSDRPVAERARAALHMVSQEEQKVAIESSESSESSSSSPSDGPESQSPSEGGPVPEAHDDGSPPSKSPPAEETSLQGDMELLADFLRLDETAECNDVANFARSLLEVRDDGTAAAAKPLRTVRKTASSKKAAGSKKGAGSKSIDREAPTHAAADPPKPAAPTCNAPREQKRKRSTGGVHLVGWHTAVNVPAGSLPKSSWSRSTLRQGLRAHVPPVDRLVVDHVADSNAPQCNAESDELAPNATRTKGSSARNNQRKRAVRFAKRKESVVAVVAESDEEEAPALCVEAIAVSNKARNKLPSSERRVTTFSTPSISPQATNMLTFLGTATPSTQQGNHPAGPMTQPKRVIIQSAGMLLRPIPHAKNVSGYKGVYPGRKGRWQAQFNHKSIGGFATAWEAGVAVAMEIARRDFGLAVAEAPALGAASEGDE